MRVGQAKELFRALTQQYFGGANVVFANQSRTAKQKEPLVVLTPGNVHRPQAPNYTFVDGEIVGHYLSRFSITVDLFTNGSPVVDEVSGKVVAYEDNAVDDMLSFADFLNSEHTVQWSHQNDVSILIDGDVLNLKSRLTQLLALSSAIDWGNIGEATVVCKDIDDESRLFRLNLYGNDDKK